MTDRPFIPSGDPAPRDPRELPLLVSGGIGGAPVGPPAPRWRVLLRFLFGGRLRRDVLEALEERWLNADDDVRYELNRLPRPATMRRRIRRLFRREAAEACDNAQEDPPPIPEGTMIDRHGCWPPIEPAQAELRVRMRASQRRHLAGSSPAHVPLVDERTRTWWQALLGIGEARWWLDLEEGDTAERWPAVMAPHNGGAAGWSCRFGYLLDSTFVVLPQVGCKYCGKRLDWPNFYIGKRIGCRNWQRILISVTLGLLELPARGWRRLRYAVRRRRNATWR